MKRKSSKVKLTPEEKKAKQRDYAREWYRRNKSLAAQGRPDLRMEIDEALNLNAFKNIPQDCKSAKARALRHLATTRSADEV